MMLLCMCGNNPADSRGLSTLFSCALPCGFYEWMISTVTLAHIRDAREHMILARETHLDSLVYRMENPEIRKMMGTLITGGLDLELAGSDACRI